MRSIIVLFFIGFIGGNTLAQTLENGKVVEYDLPEEDCAEGVFYIGKFYLGAYELSANIEGYDANYNGWKILIGRRWGRSVSLNELYNNVGGTFYYLLEGNLHFHLWWKSEYKNIHKGWIPHIKAEYQKGGILIDAEEPDNLSNAIKLASVIGQRSTRVEMTELRVSGLIQAEEILVEANGNTADFVFDKNYQLRDLSEVETFINANKRLPGIPSAAQMEEQGVNLAEMNKLLLQKVEELTLYAIKKEKRIEKIEEERIKNKGEMEVLNKALKEERRVRIKLEERIVRLEELLLKDE
ncbi:hypothetical protein [Saccharicrinis fermentans]|uniref:Uncharacterized protein n=1 Tax=Saccharicrinis fermentans DSM 9555 = JCM 21142 TaxID=869213 RepID=W7Y492_9BACT|nr:hypothetical protein [Saccharicrinis fermentans]GAF02393.1 hypothetical protein JCM21142_31027 [Saccharicrinis fermentans DSM 9555 = JCM 21142]